MLPNLFIPSQIATDPNDFFGRDEELIKIERSLTKSSCVIQGQMGIGKSSLAYQTRLLMEGFNSDHRSRAILVVMNQDVVTLDDMARLVLERLVSIDQTARKVTWKVPYINFVEIENAELASNFSTGRHLAALIRLLEREYLDNVVDPKHLFIIAVDEADKNPPLLANFVRTLVTETEGNGIRNLRFLVSGVRPFFSRMVATDPGMVRFFPSPLSLHGLREDKAEDLLHSKFTEGIKLARDRGFDIGVHPEVVTKIALLSGGNPSIIQLLGSHVIDSENDEPNGMIDGRDLLTALARICREDRNGLYNDLIIKLEGAGMMEAFISLIGSMSRTFPTKIPRQTARAVISGPELSWLRENNIIYEHDIFYFLDDELIKVRIILDADQRFFDQAQLEEHYTLLSEMDYGLESDESSEEEEEFDWESDQNDY